MTAFKTEINAVCAHLSGLGRYTERKTQTVFETGLFSGPQGDWEVFVCEVGKGNRAASSITTVGIMALDPDVVVFAGVAGGCKDVSKVDVVAADKIYYYEAGADGATFRPRPDIGKPSHRMVQQARAVTYCTRVEAGIDTIMFVPQKGLLHRKTEHSLAFIDFAETTPKGAIFLYAAESFKSRETFTRFVRLVFHELGHVVLHFQKLLTEPRSKAQTNDEEVEAWIFSACLVALLASRDVKNGGGPFWTVK